MKNIFTILTAIILTASVWAQVPLKMSYQAIIRNSSNHLVTNHIVGMRISIIKDSITGTPVYVETQIPTTNLNGLVSIEIGGGNVVSGTTANINWTKGPFFIKTETDTAGGTNYTIIATSQLLTVPYAFLANYSFTANYSDTARVADSTLNNGFTNFLVFDSSGTYNFIVPNGIHNTMVEIWGGGGGGGFDTTGHYSTGEYHGCSGGGGGYGKSIFHFHAGDNITVIVGAGGSGLESCCGNGGDGGYSSFGISGTYIYASGGIGGHGPCNPPYLFGPVCYTLGGTSNGAINISGGKGYYSTGGDSPNGGSGGVIFGDNGGQDGRAPGGGGASIGIGGDSSGIGANGRVIVYW